MCVRCNGRMCACTRCTCTDAHTQCSLSASCSVEAFGREGHQVDFIFLMSGVGVCAAGNADPQNRKNVKKMMLFPIALFVGSTFPQILKTSILLVSFQAVCVFHSTARKFNRISKICIIYSETSQILHLLNFYTSKHSTGFVGTENALTTLDHLPTF